MPTKRFYNLPDEKKQRIIKASVEELSSVNIDNLSINRIVKKAEIPRGSFYEYFENKFDLVDFLLDDFRNQMKDYARKSVLNNKGNIFDLAEKMFIFTVEYGFRNKKIQFFKNIFSCIRYAEYNDFKYVFSQKELALDELVKMLDFSDLNLKSKDEFLCFTDILLDIFKAEIAVIFLDPDNREKHTQNFFTKVNMLKSGVLKPKFKGESHD